MARKSINKSEQVRRYMAKHPAAKPKQIAAAVGAPISTVYNVRATASDKKGAAAKTSVRKKPGRKPAAAASKKRAVASAGSNGHGSIDVLGAAEFVKSCGGIAAARKAIDTVETVAAAVR